MKKERIYTYFRFFYVVVFLVILILFVYRRNQFLNVMSFPDKSTYHDGTENNHSLVDLDTSKGLELSYNLNTSIEYPYIGLSISVPKEFSKTFKHSNYLEISISSNQKKIIPIVLIEELNCFSIHGKTLAKRQLNFELSVNTGNETYQIPFTDFKVPYWWLNQNNVNNEDLPAFVPQNISEIALQNNILAKVGTLDSYTVTSLKIQKDWKNYLFLLPFILLISVELCIRLDQKKEVVIIFKPINENIELTKVDEWSLIQTYIANNIQNENLKLELIEKETGIRKVKISELVKQKSSLSFREYLNQIRINEAKNLLGTTKMSISEIAYNIGFSNPTHFNRVFKQLTEFSPTEFKNSKQ